MQNDERPTVALRQHAELIPPDAGLELVSTSIGPGGVLAAMWASPAGRDGLLSRTVDDGGPTFPLTRTPESVTVQVAAYDPAPVFGRVLSGVQPAHSSAHLLPGGRTLLVGARCANNADGPEHNAVVYDDAGGVERTGVLGDGIEHVATTAAGDIWVGYFDEGVFGNYGWLDPVGSSGLLRFDENLTQAWEFTSPGEGLAIFDCYALNVTDAEVWACYYTDFPIVRIRDGQIRAWRSGRAAHAVLADGDAVALARGYGADHDWIAAGRLDGGEAHFGPDRRMVMPDGAPLPPPVRIHAHGPELSLIHDNIWYKLGLGDI
ncbi:MAG: hypothetical protein HOQ24_07850 [Mycobacteriaceae bacterium]|nr:hypothetical protein [Mycobacteriaceae bacterium]